MYKVLYEPETELKRRRPITQRTLNGMPKAEAFVDQRYNANSK
jgi:hypothetical protein